jgi:hypothetical protein
MRLIDLIPLILPILVGEPGLSIDHPGGLVALGFVKGVSGEAETDFARAANSSNGDMISA